MITAAKDLVSSKVTGAWIRGVIGKYAELKDFRIDSAAKKLRIQIRLKGEADDIELAVDRYEVAREGEKYSVTISRIECSKEWIRLIATDHLIGKKIELPAMAAKVL